MSEEIKQEETVVETPAQEEVVVNEVPEKPKQFMLMVDQNTMPFLARVIPGLMYVEVEGWTPEDNKDHMFLVNPTPKKDA